MLDFKKIDGQTIKNLEQRGFILNMNLFELLKREKTLKDNIEKINGKINKNIHVEDDKIELKKFKIELNHLMNEINQITHLIPNILHHTVPIGKGQDDNILIKTQFDENIKETTTDHAQIGKTFGLEIETGVELAHARFNVMRGKIAKKNRELLNKALDFYADKGYEEFYVPNLVNEKTIFGTGQYPKFKEELFCTDDENKLFLIPTGEVPLTNVFANKILTEETAENKVMTHTPCFRKEVGAHGKDTKGILRQHQFEKVELVRTCLPENGLQNLDEMMNDIDLFVKQFNLPYRVIELCAGDIGFQGHKAYDFEIWFPAEKKYREIATVTWCHEFQARRMNLKVKRNNKKEYLHTLNGTGLEIHDTM